MKLLFYIILFGSLMTYNDSANAQNSVSDKQAIQMLKEFYISYNTAWSSHLQTGVLIKKLDSLQRKCCTTTLRNEQKKEGLDHDLILDDQGTDVEHLKTLTVTGNDAKSNEYIVSYIAHTLNAAYKSVDIRVSIHVRVVKEDGEYKIASTDMSRSN